MMRTKSSRLFLLIYSMTLIALLVSQTQANQRADQFTQDTISHSTEILFSVSNDQSLQEAIVQAHTLADYVSANAGPRQLDAMVRAESALSILKLIDLSNTKDPDIIARAFANSPAFMTELGLLVSTDDKPDAVIRVAMELLIQRPEQVKRYPALAAAICVVHDLPKNTKYTIRVNENRPVGPPPLAIFDFYVTNARTMAISPDRLPAIDLVFVVDVSESIEQLQWAHTTYRTNPGIDKRFFEIVYDYDHFRKGTEKKVTQAGDCSLTQIKKYGGVCADQAYFAMSIAKACGIPSGYVRARGANVSHAWVGFLEVRGRRAEWNFAAGRYPAYQKLRGNMRDPQSGKYISDGRVGILGDAIKATPQQVHHAMASGLVVARMNQSLWKPPAEMDLDPKGNIRKARTDSIADRLLLLRLTLGKCAGVPRAWDNVTEIARSGKMTQSQLDVWARAAMQLAGKTHQDFSYDFLVDLISTVEDPQEQHQMWEWAFGQFRTRPDLAAGVRFEQGQLWDTNAKPEMAWLAYQDVLDKFLNEGPMSVNAISAMGKLLSKNGKRDAYLKLLEDTAPKVTKPKKMASNFAKQSNYYKIHWRLVKELEYHNRMNDAQRLRATIHMPASD